ncbi:CotH kinase family protein [Clostridium aminobutyricum]|uniref:CotH kinase family protein n=1 Tax=Clostridium aminobutyricum TaxID=33953 RepID=A0A939D7T8_CLOAM|nr:CotH kinase family protein [Clostridium aminobutyricum]MBN7773094.1 CotH kinase family protein [Clostridium aminobutyricum]
MITSKYTPFIAWLLITALVAAAGIGTWLVHTGKLSVSAAEPEYVSKIFDQDVISIDITADEDEWQNMLDNATAEEFISCDMTIAGKSLSQVGIRPKGNSSLTQVASSDSDRFSFKIKFDKYVDQTCYGLDSLAVNNLQADYTYLKDYIAYDLMRTADVHAPLTTFANITVNGKPWGLYVAVETYSDSFVSRVYGTQDNNLYSVKSMDRNGGKGQESINTSKGAMGIPPDVSMMGPPGNERPEGADAASEGAMSMPRNNNTSGGGMGMHRNNTSGGAMGMHGGGGGSTGGDLVYSDDNWESYTAIFSNAVFKKTDEEDYSNVIASIKALNEGTDMETYWDVDQLIRYLAAHTFTVNLDSYISDMKQNYFLSEKDGVVSVLPWDYNLAFGGFGGTASSTVNFPIDTPVSGVSMEDRPLVNALLSNKDYLVKYHEYLQDLVDYVNSNEFENKYDHIVEAISPYVEKDATAFCTYEEFQTATPMFYKLLTLRAESIQGQLNGTIPSTADGQAADNSGLMDASGITLSALGGQGGGKGGGQGAPGRGQMTPPNGGMDFNKENF